MTADAPIRRSPLGAETAAPIVVATSGTVGGLAIRELPFAAQVDLRLAPEPAIVDAVERALGVRPSTHPNRSTAGAGLRALWLGPDEWLIVEPTGDPDQLERRVAAAVEPLGGSVVDVSAVRTILEISGPTVRDLLARGCSLDLHPSAFPSGTCAQSPLAHVDVVLDCVETDRFWVFVRASFAPYLAAWLADALALMTAAVDDAVSA